MELKDRLRTLRKEFNISADELGNLIGCGKSAIYNYEQGFRTPRYDVLIKIADYFDVNIDYLLGRTDDKTNFQSESSNTLGNIIKQYRVMNGLSMEQFGNMAGLSKQYSSLNNTAPDSEFDVSDFHCVIKNLRIKHSFTQEHLAQLLGVSKSTVAMWETGKRLPSPELFNLLADIFDVNIDYLMGRTNISKVIPTDLPVTINVFDKIVSGMPFDGTTNVISTEVISRELSLTGDFFGLRIHDSYMKPRICPGDTVIVRRQDYADSCDLVIALVNNESICSFLRKYRDGLEFIPLNPNCKPLFLSYKDINSVTIIGKVVELRGKL